MKKSPRRNPESGIYLVLLGVFFSLGALVLIGVMIGVSLISAGKGQLQNVANMTALGALENFVEDKTSETYAERRAAALSRANSIAGGNTVKGGKTFLGGLSLCAAQNCAVAGGGQVTFGQWYTEKPASGDPCAALEKEYPCFAANSGEANSLTQTTNAARVNLCNADPDNPILAPFMPWPAHRCVESFAALTTSCTAFLLDLSRSTAFETHYASLNAGDVGFDGSSDSRFGGTIRIMRPLLRSNAPWSLDTSNLDNFNPATVGLPFYDYDAVKNLHCTVSDGTTPFQPSHSYYPQPLFWCSMAAQRPTGLAIDPKVHFQSDYRLRYARVPGTNTTKQILVDTLYDETSEYFGPQPMESLFRGINAALRYMQQRRTSGDQAVLMTFTDNILDREPDAGMSTDLGFMIQLTNFENRGLRSAGGSLVKPIVHPNFLDKGWFIDPVRFRQDRSNLVLAFDTAIETLKSYCPANSDKRIMVFTDGIGTCARSSSGFQSNVQPNPGYTYACGSDLDTDKTKALESEFQFKGERAEPGYTHDFMGNPNVLTALTKAGIRASFFISGDHVGPSEINRKVPGASPERFMTQSEAVSLGYGKSHQNDLNKYFVAWSPVCPNPENGTKLGEYCSSWGPDPASAAFANFPKWGFTYPSVGVTYGPIALDTGGVWCPLRPRCKDNGSFFETPNSSCGSSGCYDQNGRLKDSVRAAGKSQYCSLADKNKSEQAADCAVQAVGGNPYMLVKEGEIPTTVEEPIGGIQ